jgi:hypothetical protein
MPRSHHTSYDAEATAQCERALVTLIGDIGPWSHSIYLVGGLAPRYIVDALPHGVPPHIGTTDVDLVIGVCSFFGQDVAVRVAWCGRLTAGGGCGDEGRSGGLALLSREEAAWIVEGLSERRNGRLSTRSRTRLLARILSIVSRWVLVILIS